MGRSAQNIYVQGPIALHLSGDHNIARSMPVTAISLWILALFLVYVAASEFTQLFGRER